ETVGWTLKSAAFELPVTVKVTDWPLSSAGPAEMAVAQAALYAPESSSTVTSPPLVNDGASLTALTVMVKVCGAELSTPPLTVPPSSWRVTVTVALPLASGAGYKTIIRSADAGWTPQRAALVLPVTVKFTVWPHSFAGPAEMAVAQAALYAPESSSTV